MRKIVTGVFTVLALGGVLLLSLPTILHKAGLHPSYSGPTVIITGQARSHYYHQSRCAGGVGRNRGRSHRGNGF